MNLMKNSKSLFKKSEWLPLKSYTYCKKTSKIYSKRLVHRKSLPPLAGKNELEQKKLKEDDDDMLPAKVNKLPRDIFGATILPQNLSFENSKKLSENQIRLEDIPISDENEVAEMMIAEKQRARKRYESNVKKVEKPNEDSSVVIVDADLLKQAKDFKKSVGELFCIADPYDNIPGPKFFRNIVNTLKRCAFQLTMVSMFRFIKKNALMPFRVYGPIVKLPEILGGRIILISRPEHIFEIFEQDQRCPINSTLDSVQRCRLQRYRKNNLPDHHITDEWENIRERFNKSAMRGSEKYFDGIDEAASKFVARIRTIKNRRNEVPDAFLFEINKWSMECLCYLIFDKPFGFLDTESTSWPSKTTQLLYSVTVATKSLCHLETGFQLWRFMNTSSLTSLSSACSILENIISEYVGQIQLGLIKERGSKQSESLESLSLVEGLLLQDNLAPDDIVSNILDNFLIGMNTMSTALGFLFYHLSQNPRVQRELFKELKEILPEKYSRLEYEQLRLLKYLQACLKESLRLKMPMPVLNRVLSNNVILNNYQIPKGTFILMTAQVEGMKEENFDNPTEFRPERWLNHDIGHPFTSLPIRNYFEDCFERQMAEASIWVCASHVLRHFSIEYQYGDIEATSTTISFPNKPLKFTFNEREV